MHRDSSLTPYGTYTGPSPRHGGMIFHILIWWLVRTVLNRCGIGRTGSTFGKAPLSLRTSRSRWTWCLTFLRRIVPIDSTIIIMSRFLLWLGSSIPHCFVVGSTSAAVWKYDMSRGRCHWIESNITVFHSFLGVIFAHFGMWIHDCPYNSRVE